MEQVGVVSGARAGRLLGLQKITDASSQEAALRTLENQGCTPWGQQDERKVLLRFL